MPNCIEEPTCWVHLELLYGGDLRWGDTTRPHPALVRVAAASAILYLAAWYWSTWYCSAALCFPFTRMVMVDIVLRLECLSFFIYLFRFSLLCDGFCDRPKSRERRQPEKERSSWRLGRRRMRGSGGWEGSSWTGIRCEDANTRYGFYQQEKDTSAVRIEHFVDNRCKPRLIFRSRVLYGAYMSSRRR